MKTNKTKKENNIEKSLELSIVDDNIKNLTIDFSEISIDQLLDDGILKDIPIAGTFAKIYSVGVNIKDRLFLKKVFSFLNQVKDIPTKEREEAIQKINNDKNHRIKIGEKLLYILDSCNDYESSERVGILFREFLRGNISREDFEKGAIILGVISNYDFKYFLKVNGSYLSIEDVGSLLGIGLYELRHGDTTVNVTEKRDYQPYGPDDNEKEYVSEISGDSMEVHLSHISETILDIFSPEYKKPKAIKI